MNRLFIDSSYIIAAVVQKDQYNEKAEQPEIPSDPKTPGARSRN